MSTLCPACGASEGVCTPDGDEELEERVTALEREVRGRTRSWGGSTEPTWDSPSWFTFPETPPTVPHGKDGSPAIHLRLERVRAVTVNTQLGPKRQGLTVMLGAEQPVHIVAAPEQVSAFLRALGLS